MSFGYYLGVGANDIPQCGSGYFSLAIISIDSLYMEIIRQNGDKWPAVCIKYHIDFKSLDIE